MDNINRRMVRCCIIQIELGLYAWSVLIEVLIEFSKFIICIYKVMVVACKASVLESLIAYHSLTAVPWVRSKFLEVF